MNNVEYHEAIPTEYCGVKFRSKSEAIFARGLEFRQFIWQYEPWWWNVKGWTPDFWAIRQSVTSHINVSLLIEYKPRIVTDTYKDLLLKRFHDLGQQTCGHLCVLACGNWFDKEYDTFYISDAGKWKRCEKELQLFQFIEEAAKFRFDLQPAYA